MALDPHEDAFVTAFIVPDKREWYRMLLGSAKRRKEFLKVLYHQLDTVPGLTTLIPSRTRTVEHIEPMLKAKGAGKTCRVIASDTDIDGQDMPLRAALEATLDFDSGAILCCVPGRLALYRDEWDAYVLEKA